ncbi:MAG: DUF4129 domain-containing protein [Saprospiraceae bacterium]|nr:DUF4129 domain-containing protein [Saprospiraceae bacterium]
MLKPVLLLFLPLSLLAQQETDSLWAPEMEMDSLYMEEEVAEEYPHERMPYHPTPLDTVAMREVDQERWKDASAGLDYSKDVPKPPKEQKNTEDVPQEQQPELDWTGMFRGLGVLVQLLAVLLALGIISYGVYRMLKAPRNRIIARDGTEITVANLEEYLHETDLDGFLQQARANANWPMAVRIYFLQIIKQLSEQGAIQWSKEKTNRDYIWEMRNHRQGAAFREVVRHYERVWYGSQPISKAAFEQMEPEFRTLLGR